MGLFGTRCGCGRWLTVDRCQHCDQPQHDGHDKTCPDCKTQAASWGKAGKEIDDLPHPPAEVLHDMNGQPGAPGPAPRLPVGSVGRCPQCGGRTYMTDTGAWCPRAHCPGDA